MSIRSVCAVLVGVLLYALPASAEAKLSVGEIDLLFRQANDAFQQANALSKNPEGAKKLYEKAILIYEKIVNEGRIENAKLYYNLGNAYFLKEDIGRAILNYRRALNLDRADQNIRKNLEFARDRRIDKVPVKAEKRVVQTLFFWHYDFSLKTKFVLSCTFFAIVCVSLTAMVWLGRSAPATAAAVICVVLMMSFFVSEVLEARERASKTSGVIIAEQVVAHQADWESSPPSFKEPLHAGTEFELIERRRGWVHIRLSDDSDGWVPIDSAELI